MEPDWIHLPPGLEGDSLWSLLHDAELMAIRTDGLERSAVLKFRIPHLVSHAGDADGLVLQFHLADVTSLRALTLVLWPGPAPEVAGKGYEEQRRLINEYRSKDREESMAWREIEEAVGPAEFDVFLASLATQQDGLTMRIEGTLDDERWCILFVRASRLSISDRDGSTLALEEAIQLGEEYWERFSTRSTRLTGKKLPGGSP
jgi:hypothetical protein